MTSTEAKSVSATVLLVVGVLASGREAYAQLRLQPYASGFSLPVGFLQDPTDPAIHMVIEQAGRIRVVRNGVTQPVDFLDLRPLVNCCGERGLLGFAFSPDYATSRRFYVNYTNSVGDTVVARYKRSSADPLVADSASRFDLKWISLGGAAFIPHPSEFGNHNGGNLMFGPDGFLYIGTGDGGAGGDPFNWAQTPNSLLGKLLRIDVNVPDGNAQGYQIPATNPFVGITGYFPEVWDFGVRNPWRFSFDNVTGGTNALVIADVGQGAREEIDYEPASRGGKNYGWRVREGLLPYDGSLPPAFLPLTDPIYDYDHTIGNSITGGFVYRGSGLTAFFHGRYFFADFVVGRIWSLGLSIDPSTGAATAAGIIEHTGELGGAAAVGNISSFGRDGDGELYIVQYAGTIQKLVPPTAPTRYVAITDFTGDGQPDLLSQSLNGNATLAIHQGSVFNNVQRIYDDVSSWRVVGVGDLNRDGRPDVVWQGPTGAIVAWLLPSLSSFQPITVYGGISDWRVVGVADMNRDGDPDLIWQSPSGQVVIWLLRQGAFQSAQTVWPSASDWRVVGAGDFNGDGDPDLLWQGPTGALVMWAMHGTAVSTAQFVYGGQSDWRVIGVGDLDGDTKPDIFWQSPTGQIVVWLVTAVGGGNATFTNRYLNRFGVQWELAVTPQP